MTVHAKKQDAADLEYQIAACERVLDTTLDDYCARLYAQLPPWISGAMSLPDARFLFRDVILAGVGQIVELGTGSGVSTAFLAEALTTARRAGLHDGEISVTTVDSVRRFHAGEERAIGDAARAMLKPSVLRDVEFLNPADASTVRSRYEPHTIPYLFIDANRRHPNPTLDLITLLEHVALNGVVTLRDVNLPSLANDGSWGAKWVFDELGVDWQTPAHDSLPNIASFRMPDDRAPLRGRLLEILYDHPWESEPQVTRLTEALA